MPDAEPIVWMETVTLPESDVPVLVVLEERQGNQVLVRQVDPGEPKPARIPIYDGDHVTVMTAYSHIGIHQLETSEDNSDLVPSMRIVPVSHENNNEVWARTLRHGEPDDGRRVHVRPGGQVRFDQGTLVAELDAIDAHEVATESGYVPLASVLSTWLAFGREHWDDDAVRYLGAAARRLDVANEMFIRVRALETEVNTNSFSGPQLRRRLFAVVGLIEIAMISLGRAVKMIKEAPEHFDVTVAIPETLLESYPAIHAIRNAYEHIEDRAFGTHFGSTDPAALSIFDYSSIFREDVIVCGAHTFDIADQADRVLAESRATLKAMVADAIPPKQVNA